MILSYNIEMKPRANPLLKHGLKAVDPDGFASPHIFNDNRRGQTKTELVRLMRKQNAAEFIGTLQPRINRFGLSKGQFSLIDILDAITAQTGPAHLTLSTWTAARADLSRLEEMLAERFVTVRFLLDFSFQRRQPSLIAHIRKLFGDQSIVVTRNHAKFCLISRDDWRLVIRTSMNLNHNPRLEDVEIKDDPDLYGFLDRIVTEFFDAHNTSAQKTKTVRELGGEFARFTA